MKKNNLFLNLLMTASLIILSGNASAGEDSVASKINSVKLYQNQAKIIRQARLSLKKGQNTIVLGRLPKLLYDWSAKGSLPKNFKGKILSLEVVEKALLKKRQKRILHIEAELEKVKEKDQVYLDDLKNIKSQEKFLNSILEFTKQNVSKELATRIPQVKVWDNTLGYVSGKKKELLKLKRDIEKKREKLGKEIQKWEFELSQIAGYNYFTTYQTLNRAITQNKAAMNVQQFADITGKYAERDKLLKRPAGKVDIEKQLIIEIFSSRRADVDFTFSYIIPNTHWKMQYDIRASNKNKSIEMVVYGSIYQKTGEDWEDINLYLSTGSPVNAIKPPVLYPWFLDVYSSPAPPVKVYAQKSERKKRGKKYKGDSAGAEPMEEAENIPQSVISEEGPYMEISLPMKQSIISSNKYQKKFVKDYKLQGNDNVKFYYELSPAKVRNSFLRVKTTNSTKLPWLSGESQIFLESEFMGKVSIPFTPPGKEEDIVLGIESRITSKKELLKKYEDTTGVFGGNRRILYKYKITVENQLPDKTEVIVQDSIPVSRNKKIQVELKRLSHPFMENEKFKKSAHYARGLRKWKLNLDQHQKKEIIYEIVISFDKDITINGLR